MQWSSYQETIFNFVETSNESAVINARAGAGKTSTIVECAKRASKSGKSILFLAFNKSIASELSERMSLYQNVVCKTLHSHGYGALMAYKKSRLNLDTNKWYSYLHNNLSVLSNTVFEDKTEQNNFVRRCIDLFDLCRINLVVADGTTSSFRAIDEIAAHHGICEEYDEYAVVSSMLEIAYSLEDNTVDYVDMIVLPCMIDGIKRCIKKYDLVFVDECQDLSQAQRTLLTNTIKRGGRFIAVGDPNQAITGFAGADCDSFFKLRELAHGKEFPLSVCYRCGKSIIELAQTIVPSIEAYEGSSDGAVITSKSLDSVQKGDVILSRKSAPLVSICLKFLASGIPAKIKGKDMLEGLMKIVERNDSFEKLYKYLDKEYDKVIKKLERKGDKDPANSIQAITFLDKMECIKTIAESCEHYSELSTRMNAIFTDYTDGRYITLSTIHKAKGLEFDRVFIILPQDLPLKWKGQKDWELQQEMNLKYVAYTRARKELVIVDSDLETLLSN